MSPLRVRVELCLVVSALLASNVMAQTATGGSIRGYVKDEQDAVLVGVTLTATSPDAPAAQVVTSDDAGYYRLIDLAPGTYTVRAEREGFARWERESVVVRAGLNLSVPVVMKVGSRTETVQVIAETPLLESRSVTQTVNVSGDLQRDAPLSGRRNWADSLLIIPGSASQEALNNTHFFWVHGADLGSNTFQIDGADAASSVNNGPQHINLSTEAIQDVAIKTGSVDASTPLGLGAAMSVTTKEGTNRVRGAASLVGRARGWNSNNVPGGTAAAISFRQADLAIGGPIVRNRAWFFGSYRRADSSTGLSRTATQIARVQALVADFVPFNLKHTANVSFIKSSVAFTPTHRLWASYQRDPTGTDTAGADVAAASRTTFGGNGAAVRVQSNLPSFTIQASASYNNRGSSAQARNADQPSRIAYQSTTLSGGRLSGIGRIAGYGASSTSSNVVAGEKVTISVDATLFKQGWSGPHQLQTGVFVQPKLAQRVALIYVGGGAAFEEHVLLDPQNPSKGTRIFRTQTYDNVHQPFSDLGGSDLAFYVQDSWSPIESVTASLGFRVDFIRRTDHLFDLPTQRSRDIGPRLGITYAVTNDGMTVARLSWSRVHESAAQNWISLGSSAAGFLDRYDLNGDGVLETTFPTLASTRLNPALFIDVDRYHQPRADQWNAGLSRQFRGRLVVDVGFMNRALRDGTAYLETNAIYDGGFFQGYRNENLPQGIFQVTNNRWNWQVVRELGLSVTKQTERVQMIGTYSRQWRHLGGTWQPNDPASIIQAAAFANNRGIGRLNDTGGGPNQNGLSGTALAQHIGPSSQWRDHLARLAVSYRAPWGVTLAANTSVESGPWSGPVVTRLAAADPAFGPATVTLTNGRVVPNPLATQFRFVGPTRGDAQFTLPTYFVLNLRVGKTMTVGVTKVNVAIEAFNVTNRGTPQQLINGGNQIGNINYRHGTSVQLPRSAQLSIRATF